MTLTFTYNVAQICKKGHLITDRATEHPEWTKPFCDQCGAKTQSTCGHCGKDICGVAIVTIPSFHKMDVPPNCQYCGKRFPWAGFKLPKLTKLDWKGLLVGGSLTTMLGGCYNIGPVKEFVDKQIGDWLHIPKVSAPTPIEKPKP